jgi:hypothetical protein
MAYKNIAVFQVDHFEVGGGFVWTAATCILLFLTVSDAGKP